MKILDCTLRDGGYYNDWDFGDDVVNRYLLAMQKASIDMVELGLRNIDADGFKGASYFTSESYICSLNLPEGPDYGVMLDAKTILSQNVAVDEAVKRLFVNASDSKLTFVRVACHFAEVQRSEAIVRELSSLGYNVFLNLMQITERTESEIKAASSLIESWNCVKGLYFADSLGSMSQSDVESIVSLIRIGWKGSIGIHAHNNMGEALRNTLAALNCSVDYVDSTITGMGRGAGNTETEMLVAELNVAEKGAYALEPLVELSTDIFTPMKKQLNWGSSLHYYLAARYRIHPTYIQTLLTDNHYGYAEKNAAITNLKLLRGQSSFDRDLLDKVVSFQKPEEVPHRLKARSLDALEINAQDKVVLIGAGSSVERHLEAILRLVSAESVKVLALNEANPVLKNYVDFHVLSHNAKRINYKEIFKSQKVHVIAPLNRFSEHEIEGIDLDKLIDLPMEVRKDSFCVDREKVIVPYDLTVAYAIAALISKGIESMYLLGFDGYGEGDIRQKEMSDLIHLIRSNYSNVNLISLTPTTYPVMQGSVYAEHNWL